jgi:uncharacterized protein YbjQ (UPF0145 family)
MVDRAWATTGNSFEGYRITRYLGLVRGVTVRSPGLGKSISASFRALAPGAVEEYVELCDNAREEAFQYMLHHAATLGANAVIAVRYESGELGQGLAEVLCYGTAVVVEAAQ